MAVSAWVPPENEVVRAVGLGEIAVSRAPEEVLVAYGLGSCVGVVGYDPHEQVGGLLHALLPWQRPGEANPAKFVDSGIPLLVRKMESLGAKRAAIVWRVVGGAEMLGSPAGPAAFRIGAQNVSAAQTVMQQEGLTIRASDLGGSVGRTVKLRMRDGAVIVRTLGQGEKVLA